MSKQALGLAEAQALLGAEQARAQLIARLLDERLDCLEAIERLGGIAAIEGALAVRQQEATLRDIDEALGILRYGLH